MTLDALLQTCCPREFPKDCYDDLLRKLTDGGFAKLLETRWESAGQLLCLASWWLCKVGEPDAPTPEPTPPEPAPTPTPEPDKPVFGAASSVPDAQPLLAAMANDIPQSEAMAMNSGVAGFVRSQLVRWAIMYAISLLKDSDKVEELGEDLADWIRKALQ